MSARARSRHVALVARSRRTHVRHAAEREHGDGSCGSYAALGCGHHGLRIAKLAEQAQLAGEARLEIVAVQPEIVALQHLQPKATQELFFHWIVPTEPVVHERSMT